MRYPWGKEKRVNPPSPSYGSKMVGVERTFSRRSEGGAKGGIRDDNSTHKKRKKKETTEREGREKEEMERSVWREK